MSTLADGLAAAHPIDLTVFETTFSPIGAGTIEEGVWLDGWGEVTTAPCTLQDCRPGWACHNNWPEPTGRPTELDPTFAPTPVPTPR